MNASHTADHSYVYVPSTCHLTGQNFIDTPVILLLFVDRAGLSVFLRDYSTITWINIYIPQYNLYFLSS